MNRDLSKLTGVEFSLRKKTYITRWFTKGGLGGVTEEDWRLVKPRIPTTLGNNCLYKLLGPKLVSIDSLTPNPK